MDYEQIIFTKQSGIATITLNRTAKLNSFTFRMLDEINHALARESADARVVVFRGAGRAFSAGDDLFDMGGTGHPLDKMRAGHHAMIKRIRSMRIPVMAAIHGYAFGAAFDLILACDFRVMAHSAVIGDIRINRAINTMSGAGYWLARYVGFGRASEILLLGDRIGAEQALNWGLVTRTFPDAAFDSGVRQFAERIATMPTRVIGSNKALLNYGLEHFLADSLDVEARELLETFKSADNQEGVRAFGEKRPPRFSGR